MMGSWGTVLNVVLGSLVLGLLLWGLRQRILLDRLASGLRQLRSGKWDVRLRRGPEDSEPVLETFDRLAEHLAATNSARREAPSDPPANLGTILERVGAILRPPLVAIYSYASLLVQDAGSFAGAEQQGYLNRLLVQTNGLLRLLEAPGDLSKLRQEISGLQRRVAEPSLEGRTPALVLVDEEGPRTRRLIERLSILRVRALVAPGADAARIMARAIRPSALLVNGVWAEGLGWQILAAVRSDPHLADVPVWLYDADPETGGHLHTPATILLWPISRPQDLPDADAYRVYGSEPLRQEVIEYLTRQGRRIESGSRASAPVLDLCVRLVLVLTKAAPETVPPEVLVVPLALAKNQPHRLAESFGQGPRLDGEELHRRLLDQLGHIAHAATPHPATAHATTADSQGRQGQGPTVPQGGLSDATR